MQPFEIIAAPFTIYLAAPGTARPTNVHVSPSATWTQLGISGSKSYTEDGITADMPQTLQEFRSLGTTGPRKFTRTQEDLSFEVTIMDFTPETLSKALDASPVTAQAVASGVPGSNRAALLRGLVVNSYAVLLRGPSPYNELMAAQFWIPRMVIETGPNPAINKGSGAFVMIRFRAVEDDVDGFGAWEAQNAAAS